MVQDNLPLVIGFVIMSLGSLGIYAHGSKHPEIRHHTNFHSLVPFIAATAYLAMALGVVLVLVMLVLLVGVGGTYRTLNKNLGAVEAAQAQVDNVQELSLIHI